MRPILPLLMLFVTVCCAGCATSSPQAANEASSAPAQSTAPGARATAAPAPANTAVAAYVQGEAITWSELQQPLLETAGGQVLAEAILDRMLQRRLAQRGLNVTAQDLDFERNLLLRGLSDNPDEAARLLRQLRESRGLGAQRYEQLLSRNAAMRVLVRDEVQITEAALKEAFELYYGPRFEARVIVVPTAAQATDLARQAREGAAFADLALAHSTDISRAQGGLLPPISVADVSYPQAIRAVLRSMEVAQVSAPIAVESGFAILKLERKIESQPVQFDDVQDALTERVRRRGEALAMQRLARALLEESDPVILEPALQSGWQQHKRRWSSP